MLPILVVVLMAVTASGATMCKLEHKLSTQDCTGNFGCFENGTMWTGHGCRGEADLPWIDMENNYDGDTAGWAFAHPRHTTYQTVIWL